MQAYENVRGVRPLAQVIVLAGHAGGLTEGSAKRSTRVAGAIACLTAGAVDFFPRAVSDQKAIVRSVEESLARADRWRRWLVGPIEEETRA